LCVHCVTGAFIGDNQTVASVCPTFSSVLKHPRLIFYSQFSCVAYNLDSSAVSIIAVSDI